jgi:hypothetical protein
MGRMTGRFPGRYATAAGAGLGVVLLTWSAIVAGTGGFEFHLLGLRIRSHAWERPLIAGLAAIGVVLFLARQQLIVEVPRLARRADPRMLGRALGVAAVLWTLVAGALYSTCAAGGSDASGYISQARLFAEGRLLGDDGVEARPPWPHAEMTLAPLGYRPAADIHRLAPTYPPGLPLLMAPAHLVHPAAVYLVVPVCGMVAVWMTVLIGEQYRVPVAGGLAAVLVSVSPTFLYQLVQPMSDVPVTAFWLLALWFAARRTAPAAALAGTAAGIAILTRPNLAPLAGLVLLAAAIRPGPRGRAWSVALVILPILPALVALGAIQSVRFGSPLASGYGSFDSLFAFENVRPNLERYPRWLTETHTAAIWLWVVAPLSHGRAVTPPDRWMVWIAWLFCAALFAAYLPYVYFQPQEWMYTRFLLPAIPLMWLLAMSAVLGAVGRFPRLVSTTVVAVVVAVLVACSIEAATSRFAFSMKYGEAKYVRTARLVNQHLPQNAILISMQHSGSLRYYTRRPVLRYDFVDPGWLDFATEWLRAQGYALYAVVDRWELEEMKLRYANEGYRTVERLRPRWRFGETAVYELQ